MMAGFAHDIAGGNGNLVVTALQSPNFVTGVTGWQIAKNGDVEFNNGVFRGTIAASTFEGTEFIVNAFGAFFYSGTPAPGNLIFSIASTSGNDAAWTGGAGNNYSAGIIAYGSSGGAAALVTSGGLAGILLPPSGTTNAFEAPQAFSFAGNAGAANEFQVMTLLSGEETANKGNSAVQLFSQTNDGTGGARGSLIITGNQVLGWSTTGITANQPITATAGTKTNPTVITTDTGTAATSFGANWAASGSGANGVIFWLGPDGWVNVLVDVHTTSTAPATAICNIPAGYAPASSCVAGPLLSGTNSYPLTITTTQLQAGSIPATSGVRYYASVRYPMAVIP